MKKNHLRVILAMGIIYLGLASLMFVKMAYDIYQIINQ